MIVSRKHILLGTFVILRCTALSCVPFLCLAASDSSSIIRQLAGVLKKTDGFALDYKMEAVFPNGDRDQLSGEIFLSSKNKIYYNDCTTSTMLYTQQWFYEADHNDRAIRLIDLSKEKDNKLRKQREANIFRNGALSTFLDSVLLKKGKVSQLKYTGNICHVTIKFVKEKSIESIAFTYDTLNKMPLSCDMVAFQPVSTDVRSRGAKVTISYSNFRPVTDLSKYATDVFFTCIKGKVKLKKHDNYKLLSEL